MTTSVQPIQRKQYRPTPRRARYAQILADFIAFHGGKIVVPDGGGVAGLFSWQTAIAADDLFALGLARLWLLDDNTLIIDMRRDVEGGRA